MLTIEGQRRMAAEKIADELFEFFKSSRAGAISKKMIIDMVEKIMTELDM